jgi:hypothetical protein
LEVEGGGGAGRGQEGVEQEEGKGVRGGGERGALQAGRHLWRERGRIEVESVCLYMWL